MCVCVCVSLGGLVSAQGPGFPSGPGGPDVGGERIPGGPPGAGPTDRREPQGEAPKLPRCTWFFLTIVLDVKHYEILIHCTFNCMCNNCRSKHDHRVMKPESVEIPLCSHNVTTGF